MKNLAGAAVAVAMALTSVSGQSQAATTVDFSDLISPADGLAGSGTVYSSNGLTFTSTVVDDLNHWGSANPFNADPGGATLLKLNDVVPMIVTRTGGGTFDLVSLQLAESENAAPGPAVDFSYTNGLGTFSSVLTVTVVSGLQTFVIGQTGLTSFSLGGADHQLDNVIYNVTVVPEPATYVLLAIGMLAIAGKARSRRTAPR